MKAQLSIIIAEKQCLENCLHERPLEVINCNSIKLHLDISTSLFLPFSLLFAVTMSSLETNYNHVRNLTKKLELVSYFNILW